MSYVQKLAAREAAYRPTVYITNEEFRKQKAALTRAINSGDPRKVLTCVEKTLDEWSGKAWPDDWSRWRRALEDAAQKARIAGRDDEEMWELSKELEAASLVLFR